MNSEYDLIYLEKNQADKQIIASMFFRKDKFKVQSFILARIRGREGERVYLYCVNTPNVVYPSQIY